MSKQVRKAVFPAGGLGTRFLPATKVIPKEMLALVDKPIIQYGVEEAIASGIEHIIIVTGRGKGAMEDHFDISYELDATLERKRQEGAARNLAQGIVTWRASATCARRSRWAWATPCSAPRNWSAMSRSPSFCPTM